MYILGISAYYHDSSATLLKDGEIIAAVEEERFSRKKHDNSFPVQAIQFCLDEAGIGIEKIDHIGFYEKPLLKFERVLFQHIANFPRSLKTFLKTTPNWLTERLKVIKTIRKKLKYKKDVMFIEHHLAHAASAFFASPYEKAAILTVDGVGEWSTTTYGVGHKNKIDLQKEIRFPHSLGLFYSTITAYLGFSVNNSEYKVMGLAAYGDMSRENNKYYKKLLGIFDIKKDGSLAMDMSYFAYEYAEYMPAKKFCELLGGPIKEKEAKLCQKHKDIAAAAQMILEDIVIKMLRHLKKESGLENLVFAGGVALNGVFNGKIIRKTNFKNVWIQPNASDGGGSMGVALYIYYSIFEKPRTDYMRHAYLGPKYSGRTIKNFLDNKKVKYEAIEDQKQLLQKVSKLIYNNNIVSWFQGSMEWGPRALGNRSILANPLNPNVKDLLNSKVKFREAFRPFAPVVCAEQAEEYFDCDLPLPLPLDFMLMVYPLKEQWRVKLPGIVHINGTGRLQTVKKEHSPLFYALLKEFENLSGIPMLINTSFNIRGEPIVCSPQDAYKCMTGTGIDYLVIDKFIIKRDDNPRDKWDSKILAKYD